MNSPAHPRVFVRFGNTKGEIRVKKGGVIWIWFGNQPPHPPIFGKSFPTKNVFWGPSLTDLDPVFLVELFCSADWSWHKLHQLLFALLAFCLIFQACLILCWLGLTQCVLNKLHHLLCSLQRPAHALMLSAQHMWTWSLPRLMLSSSKCFTLTHVLSAVFLLNSEE